MCENYLKSIYTKQIWIKKKKSSLEKLLKKVANEWNYEIYSLNLKTNHNPIVIEITIKKTNGDDISLDDCALFNTPHQK